MYYININVTCKGNTALDAATVVVLCTCQHSSRPWIRMRLVVLHVDGLRCAKVDYRIIVRLIPKNVCIAWRLRWFLVGARLTRYPEYRSLLHTSWSYCLVAVLNRTQQNNPAQSRMPGRNSPFINDRDEFYTQTKRFEQELPKIFMLCLHTPWGSLRCGMTNSTR